MSAKANGSQELPMILLLVICMAGLGSSLRDDWYSFTSMEDTSEWSSSYRYTCSYSFDIFREPWVLENRDSLRTRKELLSPIRFSTSQTIRAPENVTLHVYNYPALRNYYSVSYGFQRNKECLHGEDSECIVYPVLGRVRALVLSAERFGEGQDLNYVKDHFMIEDPESFLTILNGGSINERKFYEAVFLGGYPGDVHEPFRTSHQIDGKTYPLEIYMYFLDETVPSLNFATILVVFVEESDRDNRQVTPIISAIENKLYIKERRFLDRKKGMIRRERLFHHLKPSTYYDVYDTGNHVKRKERILQESLDRSVLEEALLTRFVDPFEKMEALAAELFLLIEDFERTDTAYKARYQYLTDFFAREGNDLIPTNFTEYQMLNYVIFAKTYRDFDDENIKPFSCRQYTDFYIRNWKNYFDLFDFDKFINVSQVPTGAHMDAFVDLIVKVCEHFLAKFTPLHRENEGCNNTYCNTDWTLEKKYEMMLRFTEERKAREELNLDVYNHFHGTAPQWHPYLPGHEVPNYKDDNQKLQIVDGIHEFLQQFIKAEKYLNIRGQLLEQINNIASKFEYDSLIRMQEVLLYLRHGDEQNGMKYNRGQIYEAFVNRQMPWQKAKRNIPELGGMQVPEPLITEYDKQSPEKVKIEMSFQVSWLLPTDGGYFYYEGSSPVPPCFRAQNVIVFKKPIQMTKRQIEILTRVPTSFDRDEDIRFTAPQVHDPRFEVDISSEDTEKSRIEEVRVPIYDQPRNHLFLGHDGFHKNSVDEWEKLEQELKRRKNGTVGVKANWHWIVVLIQMWLFNYR